MGDYAAVLRSTVLQEVRLIRWPGTKLHLYQVVQRSWTMFNVVVDCDANPPSHVNGTGAAAVAAAWNCFFFSRGRGGEGNWKLCEKKKLLLQARLALDAKERKTRGEEERLDKHPPASAWKEEEKVYYQGQACDRLRQILFVVYLNDNSTLTCMVRRELICCQVHLVLVLLKSNVM